jgi:hypothetical protein
MSDGHFQPLVRRIAVLSLLPALMWCFRGRTLERHGLTEFFSRRNVLSWM